MNFSLKYLFKYTLLLKKILLRIFEKYRNYAKIENFFIHVTPRAGRYKKHMLCTINE
jgi:hypothetical protein